MLLLRRLRVYC